jgi:hypothetical protein
VNTHYYLYAAEYSQAAWRAHRARILILSLTRPVDLNQSING